MGVIGQEIAVALFVGAAAIWLGRRTLGRSVKARKGRDSRAEKSSGGKGACEGCSANTKGSKGACPGCG